MNRRLRAKAKELDLSGLGLVDHPRQITTPLLLYHSSDISTRHVRGRERPFGGLCLL